MSDPVLTTGALVTEFEGKLADYLGAKHAVGTNSCTMALFLALKALGIGPGDEVITTPLTYIATAQAICYTGARPVFVDVEEAAGNLDASLIERSITRNTKAIVPVHLYGWMCDMPAIMTLAMRYNLAVVEDAAHCLEGSRDGIRPGDLSQAACFSFYATKSITCGDGGGAVVTKLLELADQVRLLSRHAIVRNENRTYCNDTLGYKANMDNLKAALLLPQMNKINARRCHRLMAAGQYAHRLTHEIRMVQQSVPWERHARHLYPIRVPAWHRDSLLYFLRDRGIECGVHYRPVHELAYFSKRFPAFCPVASRIGAETLSLPFYPEIPAEHIEEVCAAIREYFA